MAEQESVRTVVIRLGEEYPAKRLPLTIVDVAASAGRPFPPNTLLRSKRRSAQQGLIDTRHKSYPRYKRRVLTLLKKHLAFGRMLVFPEFSFCEDLEAKTQTVLKEWVGKDDEKKGAPIVIGGSYYKEADGGKLRIVSPIFVGNSGPWHQEKHRPAPAEENFGAFVESAVRTIYIFVDSPYGDFAVQVCSDALAERCGDDILRHLRGQIDFLVVPARNKSPALPERLRDLARLESWQVAYVNGASQGDSAISRRTAPYTSEFTRREPAHTVNASAMDGATEGHQHVLGTVETRRFRATPRHWPYKSRRALAFGMHLKVLAIGSHWDDIWLGCLGTLMMLQENYKADVVCTSLCDHYPYPYFGVYPLKNQLPKINGACEVISKDLGFRWHTTDDTQLVDRAFNKAKLADALAVLHHAYGDADLVFVPRSDDLNQEHVETARQAIVTFQRGDVFEYEIKDYRRAPFKPNVFVDLGGTSEKGWMKHAATTFAEKKAQVLAQLSSAILEEGVPQFADARTRGRMAIRAAENTKACDFAEAFVSEFIV